MQAGSGAQGKKSVYDERAVQRLRSPDDLDKYVQVTNPSVWVLLLACLVLLVGLLAWGVFGTVSTKLNVVSVWDGNRVACFLDANEVGRVHKGDPAFVGGQQLSVSAVPNAPISRSEASRVLGSDYLTNSVMEADEWSYVVVLEGKGGYDFVENVPLPTVITTDRMPPISLVLGG
ncbi:MAG: hypothetical protein IKG21_01425 [Atopobiaceae bacterium]|nr:hypothetical protein [Atopobiaceae bacterium]